MPIKLSDIKPNPDNPRFIRDHKFEKLVNSLREFPKMLDLRPIVIDEGNFALGGNMRLKGIEHIFDNPAVNDDMVWEDLRKKRIIPDSWIARADDFTPEEIKRFIAADNIQFGEWDYNMLANEWDAEQLIEWGLDVPSFETEKVDANDDDIKDLSDKIKSEFKIEVVCKDEQEQEMTYNKLIEEGYECRLLTL